MQRDDRGRPGELDVVGSLERAVEAAATSSYVLRLYITGSTRNSEKAVENVRKLCAEHLPGRYELEIIDISRDPLLARDRQIFAAPTLVKELPPPLRTFIGNMSETGKILVGLDLVPPGGECR